eukprot:758705_1
MKPQPTNNTEDYSQFMKPRPTSNNEDYSQCMKPQPKSNNDHEAEEKENDNATGEVLKGGMFYEVFTPQFMKPRRNNDDYSQFMKPRPTSNNEDYSQFMKPRPTSNNEDY